MKASITRLRRHGQRLKPESQDGPYVGELSVDFEVNKKPGKPPRREAHLVAAQGTQGTTVDVVSPLFNVTLVSMVNNIITLTGIELHGVRVGEDMEVFEHVQIWRCTLLTPADEGRLEP
jgi:hypothetical protein